MHNKERKEFPKAFVELIKDGRKEMKELNYGAGADKLIVKINPLPSVAKRTEAIEMAADLVFSFESGVNGYIPSLLSFARKYSVLICFTDIDLSFDLDDIWPLINATHFYDDVVKAVGRETVAEFNREVNEIIEAHKGARMRSVNLDNILEKLFGMLNGISSQLKDIDLMKVLKNFQNLPRDIKGDDFVKQIITLAKGGG